jgi:crotonobetainyl-CoA:carnitine CoA-transferase CaiB-like acyl-CoA transferase
MLSPYRVLDLTDERGLACGMVLADLGADVIQVEPPAGSPARRIGPFLKDEAEAERSLYWCAYARNKRGVVLDLDRAEGRAELRRLAETADFLIESDPPGAMAARGLGYEDLAAVNPALVYVSITPFGQRGPKARYATTDLIVHAASGGMALNGEPDRAPLRAGGISAWTYAGTEAAGAALVAHLERVRSGRGQHVDVSAQLATNLSAGFSLLSARIGQGPSVRSGGGVAIGPMRLPFIWEAADGYVSLTLLLGGPGAQFMQRLLRWLHEEGAIDAEAAARDWGTYLGQVLVGQAERAPLDALLESIGSFLRARTKRELLAGAVERSLLLVPVSTTEDVLASDQLSAREYWREHAHEHLGARLRYPGPFVSFDRTPIRYRRRAPRIGEHTDEVLVERRRNAPAPGGLSRNAPAPGGLSRNAPAPERAASGGLAPSGEPAALPLAGLKVLDFMWVMAGPYATRVLVDYGATVVKVESAGRLDLVRVLPPFYGGQLGPENSASFGSLNAGKRSLSLDLGRPGARDIVLDLVRWADVVTEAFSPGAMQRLGLDYPSLRRIKPDLIMLSTCLFGQTGPLSSMAGYGTMGAAAAGLVQPTGWPDRAPAGPFGPYTDWLAPRFTVPALLAALDHRRRTGEGQYIDQSQAESALHFLAPSLLDCAANGNVIDRVANRDTQMAPHGAYPAAGQDEWVAIAVRDAEDWQRLCGALERPDLAADNRFASVEGRRAHADALDAAISGWTRERPSVEIERRLQDAGVPAHAVMHTRLAVDDLQLGQAGHFIEVPHALHGPVLVESTRYRLSRTPAVVTRAGPTIGQDTEDLLREILGYDDARIEALRSDGALG